MKEFLDLTWEIINSSIFGVIVGYFLAILSKYLGKVKYNYVDPLEEFPKEQYPNAKAVDERDFVIDIINNKGINLVVGKMKLKYKTKEGIEKINNVLQVDEKNGERSFDTNPINIPANTGVRLLLNGSRVLKNGDVVELTVNNKKVKVNINKNNNFERVL